MRVPPSATSHPARTVTASAKASQPATYRQRSHAMERASRSTFSARCAPRRSGSPRSTIRRDCGCGAETGRTVHAPGEALSRANRPLDESLHGARRLRAGNSRAGVLAANYRCLPEPVVPRLTHRLLVPLFPLVLSRIGCHGRLRRLHTRGLETAAPLACSRLAGVSGNLLARLTGLLSTQLLLVLTDIALVSADVRTVMPDVPAVRAD